MRRILAWIFIVATGIAMIGVGYFLRNYTETRRAPEYFITLTKIEPLFYSPDIDTNAWLREVAELESLSAVMNRMYREMKSRGAVSELYARHDDIAPYPLNLLRAVPDVIRETDAFFARPTRKNAKRLLHAYQSAATAYRKDAERFFALANIEFAIRPNARITFLGSATTPEIIKNDAALLLANADALDAEIKKRMACLGGGDCELNVKKYEIASRPPAFVEPLPDVMKYYESFRHVDLSGPFFYPSRCWHNKNGAPVWELLYLLSRENPDGERTIGVKLATENYYHRIQPGAWSALISTFTQKALDFFSTVEANPYRCTDLHYWQALPTMRWLQDSLNAAPQPNSLPDGVKRLEAQYLGARYPSWDVALELANAYQDVLLGGSADPIILKRHQLLRGRLADFPATLAALNDLTAFFLKIAKADNVLPIDYFIQVSSFSSLMFMNFSDSVWLAAEKPTYLLRNYRAPENTVLPEPGEILPAERNVFTLSVLRQYLSDEEILEIHRKTREANLEIESMPLE